MGMGRLSDLICFWHQVTLQALEDSGIKYQGSKTGVFVGIGQEEHFSLSTHDRDTISAYSVTGTALSIASNRISYVFNLHGPSMSIDTACSSAVTAFDMAVKAIEDGECDQAVVAGASLLVSPCGFPNIIMHRCQFVDGSRCHDSIFKVGSHVS